MISVSHDCGLWRALLSLGQRHQDIDVVDGKEAGLAADHALIPVLIDLVGEDDEVAFLEAQFALVLWLEVVKSTTTGLVQGRLSLT